MLFKYYREMANLWGKILANNIHMLINILVNLVTYEKPVETSNED